MTSVKKITFGLSFRKKVKKSPPRLKKVKNIRLANLNGLRCKTGLEADCEKKIVKNCETALEKKKNCSKVFFTSIWDLC